MTNDQPGHNGTPQLPDVLDLLVVGGGPAGTAAAFRAQELGLSALVIDYDDLMKRIRDYAKDKQILPHFGGGDKMRFPQGGELVNRLHFDPIDKDDMCVTWKGFYETYDVPAQTGVELTGIERMGDGVWRVQTWNHRAKSEQVLKARHVALAIGRGVPRRFDIPGTTDGIAYKLDDPSQYVGEPACVIGGGTSAAEAVIALSEAKAAAGDECAVYWSYRGDALPKVSKALAEDFFNAYIGNGNVRYCPSSEPVAVVTTPEKEERLSIRIDRKVAPGRPSETVHLEFNKTRCVACIGEDIPEALLNSLGIYMVTGGPNGKKRMAVTPLLETQQPNVYLIGDLLSQAYLETDDFHADPSTFREVKHRGNIKSALRDGVFVAEVVKQKLEGRDVIQVDLAFADDKPASAQAPAPSQAAPSPQQQAAPQREHDPNTETQVIQSLVDRTGDEAAVDPERSVETGDAFLVRVTAGGVEEDEFALKPHGVTTIGRRDCTISFPEDNALSPSHASVSHSHEGHFLRDDGSETGTFLTLRPGKSYPLQSGDLLRLGQRFLLFNIQGGDVSFVHYDHTGRALQRHTIPEGTIVLGRQAPDITLDETDMALSRRHLALTRSGGRLSAKDLNSLNGTYFRVRDAIEIDDDDAFRVGMQMLKLSLREEVKSDSTTFRLTPYSQRPAPPAGSAPSPRPAAPASPAPTPAPAAPSAPKPTAPAAAPAATPATTPANGEPVVTFQGLGSAVTLQPGQTLCDAAEAEGIDLQAECHVGICGSDAVRVVSGGEHLDDVSDEESDTLQSICDLEPGNEPGQCRLACVMHATGPVVVERVAS
jgi:thioredoxin reductase/pSer/pThr/pTyr-binding forkhead associated (FHA) protein/ferredoxin